MSDNEACITPSLKAKSYHIISDSQTPHTLLKLMSKVLFEGVCTLHLAAITLKIRHCLIIFYFAGLQHYNIVNKVFI